MLFWQWENPDDAVYLDVYHREGFPNYYTSCCFEVKYLSGLIFPSSLISIHYRVLYYGLNLHITLIIDSVMEIAHHHQKVGPPVLWRGYI